VLQIRGIQSVLSPDAADPEEIVSVPPHLLPNDPDIVLDATATLIVTDICKALPHRATVDKLLSVHFNARNIQIRRYMTLIVRRFADVHSNHSQREIPPRGMFLTV
jgi:hypothetical protein